MPLKLPPPPQLPVSFGGFGQQLNRWLLEIQSILNAQGLIDPASVAGLPALIAEVATFAAQIATLTADIATLTAEVATLTASVTANTANIATNTANIATNTADIATLAARNQIRNGAGAPGAGLGSNGDLYINNTGGAGTHLYGKIGGTWVALA
jgi:ABC-type transporter Mla subunit MlaD